MKGAVKLCFVFLLLLFITTGCWNLKEPDELAFVTGNGLDLTEDGKLEASALVVIPAGIGGGQISVGNKKESFRVMSATGKNVSDALVNMQSKLSRAVFWGHRDVFLVGERLAEHGMGETIDPFLRSAQSDMRPLIYIVKNGQSKDVFSIEPFFDPFITSSLEDEQAAIGLKPYSARDFVVDVLSDGTQPLVPAVSLTPSRHYNYAGSAIMNKDDGVKLMGFLNKQESSYARWITDRLASATLTSNVPEGNGTVSLTLEKLDQRISVIQAGGQFQIDVHLTGQGTIVENNTNLDPTKRKDLQIIQSGLSKNTQKSVEKLVKKVQEDYKMDIFGFGERVHQQYPRQWKTLKANWSDTFSNLDVTVKVKLQCNDPGLTNRSIN